MEKIRVYELAKKMNMTIGEIKDNLKKIGVEVKSHMSNVDSDLEVKIREKISNSTDVKEEEEIQETIEKTQKTNKKNKNKLDINEEMDIVEIPANLTIKELSVALDRKVNEIIKMLMMEGTLATINDTINFEDATKIAERFNFITEMLPEEDILGKEFAKIDDERKAVTKQKRPPVVVVMGHVDHGKTSLLDYIRNSKVTKGEAGGITQHIGAYTIESNGEKITFLDTPGHAAFTQMRSRGASITDIVVIVVAADDGVMPQTLEAIDHAKAAGVTIIVAINKIDKPGCNLDKVKKELAERELLVEDWGGDVVAVPVSAHTGEGVDHLLEMIQLTASLEILEAEKQGKAKGTVIESALDKRRGTVATVLVQNGILKLGDPIVVGESHGKVRAMTDDKGIRVNSAGPSMPVEILGLSKVPNAGEVFYVAKNEKHARQLAESVEAKGRVDMLNASQHKVSLDDLFDKIQQGEVKELKIVIKADVQGSIEAIKTSLEKLSNEEVRVNIIHGGVGAISKTDVMLASASNAIIIGFNVSPDVNAQSEAEIEKVDLRVYNVIYNAIDDVKRAVTGMLEPIYEEKIIGTAEIRQLFKASGVGTIGGSFVMTGKLVRNCGVRITREGKLIYEGKLGALKRFKDDVKEVAKGYDCGLLFENFNDIKELDVVEGYIMEEIKR